MHRTDKRVTQPTHNRARILKAARAAFVAGGGEVEMGDVAKRAGVSIGLAYHYFGSKAGLISAVVTDFYDRHDEILNQRFDATLKWPERERLRVSRMVEFLFADPVTPILLGRLSASAEVVAIEAERREKNIERAAGSISRAQQRGVVDPGIDAEMAAALIFGGMRQAIAMTLARQDKPDAAAFTRQVWQLVAGMLALPRT